MIVAAFGAAAVGQPREGAVLMFLFSLSNTLETYAMGRTHASIRALLGMTPKEAELYRDDQIVRVPVEEICVGNLVLVRPGAQIPADGQVIEGESAVDEASITGESLPVEQAAGARVFAGTLNRQGALDVRVTTAVENSTLARIVAVVREAREQKAHCQDFTDRVIGQYYAYAVIGITLLAILIPLVFLGWDLRTTFYRAMTLMVVASPCAVVISIPATLLSALASAARGGVLFKGGRHLESASKVRLVAFDKTGTLTSGRPGVVAIIPVGFTDAGCRMKDEKGSQASVLRLSPLVPADDALGALTKAQVQLLALAAGIERLSEHPLAQAVVRGATERGIVPVEASDFMALTGMGAQVMLGGRMVRIGRPSLWPELAPDAAQLVLMQEQQGRTVVVLGDQRSPWGLIAIADTVRPEAAAPVALESADVLLMADDLSRLPRALGQAKRARRSVRQNLTFAFSVMVMLMLLTIIGNIPLPLGVVGHEGSTLLVVANGLRLLVSRR